MLDALQISNLLHKGHTYTLVASGGVCYNACFVLWMSGAMRFVSKTAELGVRRAGLKVNTDKDQATARYLSFMSRRMDGYLSMLGLPRLVVDKMNAAAPSELFLVSQRWLAEQQLLTAMSYSPDFFHKAVRECGPEPFDALTKSTALQADDQYDQWVSQFRRWNDCLNELRESQQSADRAAIRALFDESTIRRLSFPKSANLDE